MSMVMIDGEWIPPMKVSTVHKPDLQHFTPKQIEEYCDAMLDSLCCKPDIDGKDALIQIGLQIIRQLQAELAGE